jgi:predicted GTPase
MERLENLLDGSLTINYDLPVVCVIGATGTGKSALCNTLIGDSLKHTFIEGATTESQTTATQIQRGFWFGNGKEFIIVDT